MANEVVQTSLTVEAGKALPSAVLGGQIIFGYTLSEWSAIAGILYVALQTYFLISDRIKARKKK
jgi:hypothetical protein